MAENQPVIIIKNVSKSFKIPLDKSSGIKQHVVHFFSRQKGYREFNALKDVSFEIKKGEFFGIVGKNGSGKSTLLKTIAGIYAPDKGLVQVNGSLTPFIELGVGFNPELTGRENVFLNGALLGFGKKEMKTMYDEIVDFAELHDFMEERLKNYSSGMQVRLAFSIAIRAKSDILLLDEVLAVGDANFQRKCFNYFKHLKKEKTTVVLVTHDMNAVQEFCDKAIVINNGRKIYEGIPEEVAARYSEINFSDTKKSEKSKTGTKDEQQAAGTQQATISRLRIIGSGNKKPNEDIVCSVEVKINKPMPVILIGIQISDINGRPIFGITNEKDKAAFKGLKANSLLEYRFSVKNVFNNGTYFVSCALKSEDRLQLYDQKIESQKFEVNGWTRQEGSGTVILPYQTNVTMKEFDAHA